MIYDKTYIPVGADHRVFVRVDIPAISLGIGVEFTQSLQADLTGYSKQGVKVVPKDSGGGSTPQVEVRMYEKHEGSWRFRASLGLSTIDSNEQFEHNGEDIVGEVLVGLTPLVAVPDQGIFVQISGRRGA